MEVPELILTFLVGGLGYGGLEILWRGHTHWTMLLLGGVCFTVIYALTVLTRLRLWETWFFSAAAVTGLEFLSGCVLNLYLGWNVWDYAGLPGNVLGQICPAYALGWLGLCVPSSFLALFLRRRFRRRKRGEG
ncbi:MAG: hypothetical protein IJU29_06395 [Oscillospiraceae bacterium]|nr:hypothetical protein [Oscillospiraceae bacterium]